MAWRTALDIFRETVAKLPQKVALRSKVDGVWKGQTWSEWDTASREIAGGLRALGLVVGDRACILSNTRPEWVHADLGILLAGGVTVPIYQSNTPRECEYIINDCAAKVVLIEDPYQLEKLLHPEVRPRLAKVQKIVCFSDLAKLERPDAKGRVQIKLADALPESEKGWVTSLADLRSSGRDWLAKNKGALEKAWEEVTPDNIFTIVYTSGTTGPPKGVVLLHKNIVFECTGNQELLSVDENDEQLLFLPLAHIFAKILEWTAIARGITTAFAESIPKLTENMREVKPTFMGAVPRVYEKAYAKIQQSFEEKRRKPVARLLIDWALGVGRARSKEEQAGRTPSGLLAMQAALADRLVFGKIKETFGGRLRFFVSGGAPLAKEIAEFFHGCGILILEGYGLTETTAATHINRPNDYRFGTVGKPFPGVDVKIADDGEILARGGNILHEYYGKPEATKEAIDKDGWFHTGDIGIIEDGFLRITDRKKDIIVTAGGKNVAPQNLEGALKAACPYISQVMVHGDKRRFLSALITLNEEAIVPWAKEKGIVFKDVGDLAKHPDVRTFLQKYVDELNKDLASYETIKKFTILTRDLTQEAGEMTPTLKVKRKFVSEKYKEILDGFYAGGAE
jgi:long-chain acyl-CoA synthetase